MYKPKLFLLIKLTGWAFVSICAKRRISNSSAEVSVQLFSVIGSARYSRRLSYFKTPPTVCLSASVSMCATRTLSFAPSLVHTFLRFSMGCIYFRSKIQLKGLKHLLAHVRPFHYFVRTIIYFRGICEQKARTVEPWSGWTQALPPPSKKELVAAQTVSNFTSIFRELRRCRCSGRQSPCAMIIGETLIGYSLNGRGHDDNSFPPKL